MGFNQGYVQYYDNIDCNSFFPHLLSRLRGQDAPFTYKIYKNHNISTSYDSKLPNNVKLTNYKKGMALTIGKWILFSSHGARAVIQLYLERDFETEELASINDITITGTFSMEPLFPKDKCNFLCGQQDGEIVSGKKWKYNLTNEVLTLTLSDDMSGQDTYSICVSYPLRAPVHWCYESGQRIKRASNTILQKWDSEWNKFWSKYDCECEPSNLSEESNSENDSFSLDDELAKPPSADFVAIHLHHWPEEKSFSNYKNDNFAYINEFSVKGVQDGYWIKMAEFGGNYLVKLKSDGTFDEKHLFDTTKRKQGRWWLDPKVADESPNSNKLFLGLSGWRLCLNRCYQTASPDYGAFEEIRKNIDEQYFFVNGESEDHSSNKRFFPCVEIEPHRPRYTNFYIAHIFPLCESIF